MPERQQTPINPEYVKANKDAVFNAWQHLPAEHQATTALVLLAEVLDTDFGPWLREAIRLTDHHPPDTASPETITIPSSLHPAHFRDLPLPFQPESESGQALAQARLTLPGSTRVWYPSAFDGHNLFFGLVVEYELTCDYFSLADLARLRGTGGQPIQRDPKFTPQTLDDLIAHHARSLQPPDR